MAAKNQHVMPHPKGWAIKGEGNKNVSKVMSTQKLAIAEAKKIARKSKSKVLIYGKDGKIRREFNYG